MVGGYAPASAFRMCPFSDCCTAAEFTEPPAGESEPDGQSQLPHLKMILKTPRLTLRPFREDDVDRMAELFANPDFMRFSLGVFSKREQTVAFIDKVIGWDRAGMPSQYAVVPHGEKDLMGYCGFFHHPEHGIDDIEIGYRLHPDYWNRGLITEAARVVRDHGFRDLKLPRVISLVHPENVPSRRVAEKNGMSVKKEIIFRGFPTLVFSLSRERWEKENAA